MSKAKNILSLLEFDSGLSPDDFEIGDKVIMVNGMGSVAPNDTGEVTNIAKDHNHKNDLITIKWHNAKTSTPMRDNGLRHLKKV